MRRFFRILSFICIVSILATVIHLPVFAQSNSGYIINMTGGFAKDKFNKTSVFESAYGTGGKSANDECIHLVNNGEDMYFNSGSVTIDKNLVYSLRADFYIDANVRIFFFATRQHKKLSNEFTPDVLIKNSWNRIQLIYYPSSGQTKTYINGSLTEEYQLKSDTQSFLIDEANGFRFVFYPTVQNGQSLPLSVYIDNIKLYCDENIEPDSAISDKKVYVGGTALFDNKSFTDGTMTVTADAFDGDILALAQYSKDGELVSVKYNADADNEQLYLEYETVSLIDSRIKIMHLGSNLMPYNAPMEYKYIFDESIIQKTDGYPEKINHSIILDEKFDEYTGSALGNGWVINSGSVTTADDTICGGKHLNINNNLEAKKFFEPNGGNVRFDMQIAVFNSTSYVTFGLFGYNYSTEEANCVSKFSVEGNTLYIIKSTGQKEAVCTMTAGDWYNISMYYNADNHIYNVYVDNRCVMDNISYYVRNASFECFTIKAENGNNNIGIDNLRISHITENETDLIMLGEDSDILFEDDFENHTTGEVIINDVAGYVSYENDGKNGYAYCNRTAQSGTCSTLFHFPYTEDDVTLDFEVYLEDTSGATKVLSLNGGVTCSIYFEKTNLIVYGATERINVKSDVTIGEWHKVRIVTDIANSEYQLYFDGVCLMADTPMQEKKASYMDRFRFSATSGKPSAYRIDNVKIVRNHTYFGNDKEDISGYAPDTNAPKSYDWQKLHVSEPSGNIYQAEDMKLYGYNVYDGDIFNNGSYVATTNGALGVAEFTFDGSSGYYSVNVGYGEVKGKYDSFYELDHNGKRLDWWIGQNDDTYTYVRNSKRYMYVENGDIFTIKASGLCDNGILDYVEFVPAGELEEFKFGDLIDDDGTHPTGWLSSGWDSVENGGYVRFGKKVYDCRTDAHCELIHDIYPMYKSFTFDYTMKVNTSKDCFLKIGDGVSYPVCFGFGGKAVTAGGNTYSDVFKNTEEILWRVAVNTVTKTFDILVSGNVIAKNIPFDGDVYRFTQLKFVTSDGGTADFTISRVKLSAGYNVFETFRPYKDGNVPYKWSVTDATVQSMKSEGADDKSLRIGNNGSVKKTFAPVYDKLTFETQFILPATKDNVHIRIGNSNSKIGFTTKDGNICYYSDKGESGIVWEKYKANVWYLLRTELDVKNKKASFYVNDFAYKKDVDINLSYADTIDYISGGKTGYLWIDDVAVSEGVYSSSVPVPEAPELAGDYNIIMETCDLWREGNHFGYDALAPYDNRLPLLGYLEDGNLEVTDWETKFMVEHGVTVYVPCWYINANSYKSPVKDPRNSAKLHAFLKSPYEHSLDFAILVTTLPTNVTVDEFLDCVVNFWIERYFKAPNYWKIDNKPVIPIYSVDAFMTISGSDKSLLTGKIDERLKVNGFDGGIYIGVARNEVTVANGFSAKFKYNQGSTGSGTSMIKNLLGNQSSDGVSFIASPSQGMGNEPWGRNVRKLSVPLDQWYGSLKWIRDVYMPSQKQGTFSSNTLWLGNWNEYSEGHSLAPSKLTGFGYLEGVREIFTKNDPEHKDILPSKHYDYMTPILW